MKDLYEFLNDLIILCVVIYFIIAFLTGIIIFDEVNRDNTTEAFFKGILWPVVAYEYVIKD